MNNCYVLSCPDCDTARAVSGASPGVRCSRCETVIDLLPGFLLNRIGRLTVQTMAAQAEIVAGNCMRDPQPATPGPG